MDVTGLLSLQLHAAEVLVRADCLQRRQQLQGRLACERTVCVLERCGRLDDHVGASVTRRK